MPSPVHPYSDYGVALRTLKSARGWLGLLLFLSVAAQFIGFGLLWWTSQPYVGNRAALQASTKPSVVQELVKELSDRFSSKTQPGTQKAVEVVDEDFNPGTEQSRSLNIRTQWDTSYRMLVPVTQLAALIAVLSQAIIVFVTLLVVLIAQAPGVAQVTKALIWSVLVLFMYLPWQYFARDFPIPGVIYGYTEMLNLIGPQVVGDHVSGYQVWVVYGRFIVWPLVGLLALLITSERFRAGVTLAIGHPLQSMLQPRGSAGAVASVMPRPLVSMPTPEKKIV